MTERKEIETHQGTTRETYLNPDLPSDVAVKDVPIVRATEASLKEVGCLVRDPDEFTTQNGRFEIVPWPQPRWRSLDPGTGVEGGTTEGEIRLSWEDGNLIGENLALATTANKYVLALGSPPNENAEAGSVGSHVDIWYSDYHPDGGQMFFSHSSPFVANLAPPIGDDVSPGDFTAFYFEAGSGLYIHPGVWHNSVYVTPDQTPTHVFGRQGKVHARISVRWVEEFNTVLRVPLTLVSETGIPSCQPSATFFRVEEGTEFASVAAFGPLVTKTVKPNEVPCVSNRLTASR